MEPVDPSVLASHTLAVSSLSALVSRDPLPVHFALARAALSSLAPQRALDDFAAHWLASDLTRTIPLVKEALLLDSATPKEIEEPAQVDGMLCWDARAARFLENLGGEEARRTAQGVREKSRERMRAFGAEKNAQTYQSLWRLWADPSFELTPVRFALTLAKVLWVDVVAARLARLHHYKAPALVRQVLDLTTNAIHHQTQLLEEETELLLTSRKTGKTVAHIKKEDLADLARRPWAPMIDRDIPTQLAAARSLPGQRLLRFLVHKGFHQKLIEPKDDFRAVVIEGGLTELTRRLGMEPGRMSDKIRNALDALSVTRLALPHGGHEALLMWSLRPETTHRRAHLQILLGDALLPSYVFAMPDRTSSERLARRLIPFPESLPPFVGSPNLHAAQAVLQLLVLEEFSDHAVELLEQGSIALEDKKWNLLADRAEVPTRLLPEIKEAWKTGAGEKTPAFLQEPKTGRFALGKAYEKDQQVILETGEISQQSSARGKASQRARRAPCSPKTRKSKG
jgi:hypothetical protein